MAWARATAIARPMGPEAPMTRAALSRSENPSTTLRAGFSRTTLRLPCPGVCLQGPQGRKAGGRVPARQAAAFKRQDIAVHVCGEVGGEEDAEGAQLLIAAQAAHGDELAAPPPLRHRRVSAGGGAGGGRPGGRPCWAVSSIGGRVRAAATMSQPARARARAIACPRPRPAPVTTAVLPSRRGLSRRGM